MPAVTISSKGEARVRGGHPWVYRSDVAGADAAGGDIVRVESRGRALGFALYSDRSEIALRMLTRDAHPPQDTLWKDRLSEAIAYRASLQIDARRAWRQIKRIGGRAGPDAGACTVLMREIETLADRLTGADVQVVGALRPGMLARAIRVAYDPWSRPGLARLAAADPGRDGLDEGAAWPVAGDTGWSSYRTDGALHSTYWIASWPRTDVGTAFLSPLLLHAQMVRAIAVTIEPIPPLRAIREVESALTSDAADQELRQRFGFIETARRRRISESTLRREQELADGHAAMRYAGFVTVSARDEEELDRHCSEVEHAAQMAHLELVRLFGDQDVAFTYTLPLCRGLR